MSTLPLAATSSEVLDWLLEPDDPAVRAVALRDLLDAPPDNPEYVAARRASLTVAPLATILDAMAPEGYWADPDNGYTPKYRSTFWAMILLAQLGVTAADDPRIARACLRLLDTTVSPYGQISYHGGPENTFDCLQGNICRVLLQMGIADPRLDHAVDWMARTVTGDGIAPAGTRNEPMRYYMYKCGPGFACGANNHRPCAWGAAKVMLALARVPPAQRTPQVEAAIAQGVDFLLDIEPTTAAWPTPTGGAPNRAWWKFGFPVFYVTDLLQVAEALVALGYGADPRLAATLDLVRAKRKTDGRWALEYSYGSKTWVQFGQVGTPSKWVTLRALRVLESAREAQITVQPARM